VLGGIACSATADDTVRVSVSAFPDYLDPQLSHSQEGWQILWNTYLPLLTYRHVAGEPGTEVIPGLAKSLPAISSDGLTYDLTLRRDMKYSDGTAIVASDFAYAIRRLFKTNSSGSVYYTGIAGATDYAEGRSNTISGIVTNDETGSITIHLTAPNGTFTNVLALIFAAPVSPSTPLNKDMTNAPPPASGPFMIAHVDAPRTVTLTRSPQFHSVIDAGAGDFCPAGTENITVSQNSNNATQVTGVEQNTIDVMVSPPDADRLPEVQAKFGNRFRLEPTNTVDYFWLNNQRPPFDDVRVRQAVNYAIDPDAINRLLGGRLHPTQQILPPAMPGYQQYRRYPGPDLAKAKQLLAQASPTDKTITVWTGDQPERRRIAEYYGDVLTKLGFTVTLRTLAANIYYVTIGNAATPDLDTGIASWSPDFPHPDVFFRPLLNGANIRPVNSSNFSHTANTGNDSVMDALLRQQLSDETARQYAMLDQSYMRDAVWAPFGNEQLTTFVSDRIDCARTYRHVVFGADYCSFAVKHNT